MKKVLQRGFKPAKCKTALILTNSRLKILKNKKETQIKQLRRELAQLLESGNTPSARIRVEHVVREEKTVAAYELIGIYCELLVVRLGVIDSQKNCPIDLKEAVASVLFASQRLSDVPELKEIVKQFTTKYGKEFATCAIELRPDSGVSRLLVEKLSVKAPDGPTKVKILMEIATEHNVIWEAKSFMEHDPKDTEFLKGASSFQSASSVNMEEQCPIVPAPAPVNLQHGASETHHSRKNSYASDGRSSIRSNNVTSDDYYHPNARPTRSRLDEEEIGTPIRGYENSTPRSNRRRETEFVDSTEAAQAAAEAAEMASFAARAAAQLSSEERMTRQNSTESHVRFRNEASHRRNRSDLQRDSFSEDQFSPPRQNERRQYEDRYDRAKEPDIPPVVEASERHDMGESSRNTGSFGKTVKETDSSRASSHSHSSNYSDENVIGSDYMKSPVVLDEQEEENIFATEYDHQSQSSFKDTDSYYHGHDDAAGTSNEYNSFFDKPKFDVEDEYDHGVGFSLLHSKTRPTPTTSWGFKGDHSSSSHVFKESPSSTLFDDVSTSPRASYHEPDPYTKFDNYDPHSESDDDDQPIVHRSVDERVTLTSERSQKFKVSDPVGLELFHSDTEKHVDESRAQEKSDSEEVVQTGFGFRPLVGGLRNKKTLPAYRMSPEVTDASSISEKEHNVRNDAGQSMSSSSSIGKDVYTKKPSNSEKRPSSVPPQPSSSDDDDDDDDSEIQLRGRRTQTKPHEESEEEEPPAQSPYRSRERNTYRPTTGMRDLDRPNFKTRAPTSSYEDNEEFERDFARVNISKPTKTTGVSLRTKGQVKPHEKPVTTRKSGQESHGQSSSSSVSQSVRSPDPETPSKEKASHVHPNLPDYDDIFAKLGALKRR